VSGKKVGMRMNCGLCESSNKRTYYECSHRGIYWECERCGYIWLDPSARLDADKEKKRYLLHQNSLQEEGYLAHLRQLADPVFDLLSSEELRGLDFGCGPVEGMKHLGTPRGLEIDSYDPFFFPRKWEDQLSLYDFLLCCEAIEHFYHPAQELELVQRVSKKGSLWGFKSSLVPSKNEFAKWYYRSDSSHVGFFSPKSVEWIAVKFNKSIYRLEASIWILR